MVKARIVMQTIHLVKVNAKGRGQGVDFDVDKYRIKVKFWIVQYQNIYEDLPPYIWNLDRVFLSKAQAIEYVKQQLRIQDPCDPDDNVSWRICVQHDHSTPVEAYAFSSDGRIRKIKKGE